MSVVVDLLFSSDGVGLSFEIDRMKANDPQVVKMSAFGLIGFVVFVLFGPAPVDERQ